MNATGRNYNVQTSDINEAAKPYEVPGSEHDMR